MKRKENSDNVSRYMDQSIINRLFVLEAISRYAKQITKDKEQVHEVMANNIIHPAAWIESAENWIKINWGVEE